MKLEIRFITSLLEFKNTFEIKKPQKKKSPVKPKPQPSNSKSSTIIIHSN